MAETIEKKLRLTDLYDQFGKLLTAKQQEILDQYCMDDLSLAEISENLEISRQAVFDTVRKAERQLEEMESALGLLVRQERRRELLDEAAALISRLGATAPDSSETVSRLQALIVEAME